MLVLADSALYLIPILTGVYKTHGLWSTGNGNVLEVLIYAKEFWRPVERCLVSTNLPRQPPLNLAILSWNPSPLVPFHVIVVILFFQIGTRGNYVFFPSFTTQLLQCSIYFTNAFMYVFLHHGVSLGLRRPAKRCLGLTISLVNFC